MVAILLHVKLVCRIKLDISDRVCKLKYMYMTYCSGQDVCSNYLVIVYAHGRRLYSNWFGHGSTAIGYPQCSLTFMRERYLQRCREQSFTMRAYAMSAVGIDVVKVHKLFAYRVVSTFSTEILSSHMQYCRWYHKIAG